MNKWIWLLPTFLFAALHGQVEQLTFHDITFSKEAEADKTPAIFDTFGTVFIEDGYYIGFLYDEKDELKKYELHHEILRVSSSQAIEENNKVYLPARNVKDFLKLRVRVTNPNGKIVSLGENDIKTAVDEEDGSEYRYFALSGLEEGSVIEKIFLMEKVVHYTGSTWFLQSDVPKISVKFHLETPPNLEFAFKTYNGLPKVQEDTTYEDKNIWTLNIDTLEPLKAEAFSDYAMQMGQLAFKLNRNYAHAPGELYTYASIAREIYDKFHPELTRADESEIDNLLEIPEIKFARNEKDKIREIENAIKKRISILNNGEINEHLSVDDMLEDEISTENQIPRLYCSIFEYLDIEHQIVLTSSRNDYYLDPNFESPHYLNTILIYFPSDDEFLAPAEPFYRFGYFPADIANNNGVFIESTGLGDIKTGVPVIKTIKPLSAKKSYSELNLEITFIEDNKENKVEFSRRSMGLVAVNLQPVIQYIDNIKVEQLKRNLLELYCEDPNVASIELKNDDARDFGLKPLVMDAEFSTSEYIHHAGNSILFNIGKTIGAQTELYQEQERNLPVSTNYNHILDRKVTFTIPDGYKVSNLEALNMKVVHVMGDEEVNGFISRYEREGNKITVIIHEYYKRQKMPPEEFEGWQKVINAAADFNKIVLVFEKT